MVELLVVMAIVAMLIAMLLPALRSARQQASRIQCVSHLRQRGLAYVGYAQDFNEYLPHVVDGAATATTARFSEKMSLQLATYTNNTLDTWWCPELWAVRTTINNLEDWAEKPFEFKATMSTGAAGFYKPVPIWGAAEDGGPNAWGYRISVNGSRAADGSTPTPVFLGSALVAGITPNPFSGGAVVTRAPRLSDSPGSSLTIAEMYPKASFVGALNQGGHYRHDFGTGNEGGNVLRVDGSGRWYSAATSDADWHWYLRFTGSSAKEAVIQPFR